MGDHDYYTHFRGLDVELARWKGVDLKWNFIESPYISMGNNPIRNIDPLGDTIVINLFGSYDEASYHKAANNHGVLNPNVNDGVFLVYGHGHSGGVQYENTNTNQPVGIFSGKDLIQLLSKRSPEFAVATEEKKKIMLKLITCNGAADGEYYDPGTNQVINRTENIASMTSAELSKLNSESAVIAPDGFVTYGSKNGKIDITGIRQTTRKSPQNTGEGGWVVYKDGKKVSKKKDAYNGTPISTKGPKLKIENQ